MKKLLILLILFILFILFCTSYSFADWIPTYGPGFTSVKGLSNDGKTIYFSKDKVYRTNDEGETLEEITYNLPDISEISSIDGFAFSKDKIYAYGYNYGMYYLNRESFQWIKVDDTNFNNVAKMEIKNDTIIATGFGFLAISKDNGENWKQISQLENEGVIAGSDIVLHNDNIYVSIIGQFDDYDNLEIIKSSDLGETWTVIRDSLVSVNSIEIHKDLIFAATEFNGLFVSNLDDYEFVYIPIQEELYVANDVVSNGNEIAVLVNSSEVYISSDDGLTWENITYNLEGAYLTKLIEIEGKIYLSCSRGAFKLEENSWSSVSRKLEGGNVFDISQSNENLIASTYDQGVFLSADMGATWNLLDTSIISNSAEYLFVKDSSIYCTGYYMQNKVYYSTDLGNSWEKPIHIDNSFITYSVIEFNNLMIVGTSSDIRVSNDEGETWESAISELGFSFVEYEGNLLALTNDGIKITSDGYNWDNLSSDIDFLQIRELAFHNNFMITQTIYNGIYTSYDYGKNWELVNTDFIENIVSDFYVDDDEIIIFDDTGIYRSVDEGKTWELIEESIAGNPVASDIQIIGDTLFAGTNRGIFKKGLHEIVTKVENSPEVGIKDYFYAAEPFPLPAYNYVQTKIYWDDQEFDPNKVQVFNSIGAEIPNQNRISFEKHSQNSGYLNWDCTGLNPGVYVITIAHGSRKSSIKVVVGD